jgi:hypothetical protein
MQKIKKRLQKIEASRGIKPLPDFERMIPEHRDAWFKEATDEDWNQAYKKLMATIGGCKPWEVENINTLTDEGINAKIEEARAAICIDQDLN